MLVLVIAAFTSDECELGFIPITTPGWRATGEGAVVFPAKSGGTNFQVPSYSPSTGWIYVAYHDGGYRYTSGPATYEAGRQYFGSGGSGQSESKLPGPPESQGIAAIDPETGKVEWKHESATASLKAGVLATAGGLIFAGAASGDFLALDARSGKPLWQFRLVPRSPPHP